MSLDKNYKIGEIAEYLDVAPSALRFWETKFPQIVPTRTEKGQRVYTDYQISLLKRIKRLLRERGMTIEGAKKALSGEETAEEIDDPDFLRGVEGELADICRLLAEDDNK